jgi:hypothetical protein
MKRTLLFCALLTALAATFCIAGSDIPNLVGTWAVKAEGGVIKKGNDLGSKTHYKDMFSVLEAEAVITKQQGRVLTGTFKSPTATENFMGVIGTDNKSFHYVDSDGFIDGKIMDKDTIEVVYRHVTPADTVVGIGIWKRTK